MDARETSLFGLLDGSKHYVVPHYQRLYSWDAKHCEKMFKDIEEVARGTHDKHFMGSIVYVSHPAKADGANEFIVIDGQQRLTTISLLLLAVLDSLDLSPEDRVRRLNRTIRNGDEPLTSPHHFKLKLTRSDNESYKTIVQSLANGDVLQPEKSRVRDNFNLLKKLLQESQVSPEKIWDAITRLDMVYIALEAGKDDPQAIFESLNSTGKSLNATDLIRNFILMDKSDAEQAVLYDTYWAKIEDLFSARKDTEFEEFTRVYLASQLKSYPLATEVYEKFKDQVNTSYRAGDKPKEVLSKFRDAAKAYSNIHWAEGVGDEKVQQALRDYRKLRFKALHPLLLKHAAFGVSGEDFDPRALQSGLQLLETYLVRRAFAGLKSNALDSAVQKIYSYMEKSAFKDVDEVSALGEAILALRGNARFPLDAEVIYRGQSMDFYNNSNKDHILRKLERFLDPKGLGMTANLSIEHIMPQRLTSAWKDMLGPNADQIHDRLVNTIGNLTLTAYNPELGRKSFQDKKSVDGGFASSKIRLSESIVAYQTWSESEIESRGEFLMGLVVKAWPMPDFWTPDYKRIDVAEDAEDIGIVDLLRDEVIQPDDELYWVRAREGTYIARVTENGTLVLQDGDEFESPAAAIRHLSNSSYSAWKEWRHLSADGKTLEDLRAELAGNTQNLD